MTPVRPPSAESPLSEALVRALEEAGESTRGALARLYGQTAVRIGPVARGEALARLLPAGVDAIGVDFGVVGAFPARLWLVTTAHDGAHLASALLPRRAPPALDAAGREALAELANIVASSFLNGLARATRTRLLPSVPSVWEQAGERLQESLSRSGPEFFVAPLEVQLAHARTVAAVVIAVEPDALAPLLQRA